MESPNRQRAMINLAQRQIETQERAAQEIVASNIAGAEMVSSQISQQTQEMRFEIQQQTSQLQSTFESVGASISNSVSSAADKVSSSIEDLGDRLSMELAELKWQMVQQNQTLDKILNVLQENRSNEARQLVSQGVRLYVNQQYDKAEERFLRALDFDMTDYQVLMNLGYIELHKENADKSMSYFQDALSLPENLDIDSRVRTLWSIARLHYVNKDYQKALLYAEESLKVESSNPKPHFSDAIYDIFGMSRNFSGGILLPGKVWNVRDNDESICRTLEQESLKIESRHPKHIFTGGIYATLAEDKSLALSRIQSAIKVDSTLFCLAAVEPDLEPIRQEVLDLLGRMSIESFRKAVNSVEEVQQLISQLKIYKSNEQCPDFLLTVQQLFDNSKKFIQQESYSNSLKCIVDLAFVKYLCKSGSKVLPIIGDYINQLNKLIQEKMAIDQKLKSQKLQVDQSKKSQEIFDAILVPIVLIFYGTVAALIFFLFITNIGSISLLQ
jgi:tetratricopeptide (TPR) repeat protein